MEITDPQQLIDLIDQKRWDKLKGRSSRTETISSSHSPAYVEPPDYHADGCGEAPGSLLSQSPDRVLSSKVDVDTPDLIAKQVTVSGKVQRLGDFIDTDAVRVFKNYEG